jgi:hypothetical protein
MVSAKSGTLGKLEDSFNTVIGASAFALQTLTGPFSINHTYTGALTFTSNGIESSYIEEGMNEAYDRFLMTCRAFTIQNFVVAIYLLGASLSPTIVIIKATIGVMGMILRNSIKFSTFERLTFSGLSNNHVYFLLYTTGLLFLILHEQMPLLKSLTDLPYYNGIVGSSIEQAGTIDGTEYLVAEYMSLSAKCMNVNGTVNSLLSPLELRECISGYVTVSSTSILINLISSTALICYMCRGLFTQLFQQTLLQYAVLSVVSFLPFFWILFASEMHTSLKGFVVVSIWPLYMFVLGTLREQRINWLNEIESRSRFVKVYTSRLELDKSNASLEQSRLKIDELQKVINMSDEQHALITEKLTKLGPLSSFKVDLDTEVEFDKKIGSGAFGIVYTAVFRGTKVAVKQLISEKVDDENLERFQDEILLMSKLHHPNIVIMLAASWEAPHLAILLELCTKGDVRQMLLKEKNSLSNDVRVKWIKQVVSGMHYLHDRSEPVMHRDLKPDNCLVTEFYQLKISDFGESRAQVAEGDGNLTVVGTPFYIAPEVTRGDFYNEKCDVFSFALMSCCFMMDVNGDIKRVFDVSGKLRRNEKLTKQQQMKLNGKYIIHKHANGWRVDLAQWKWPKEFTDLIQACWQENYDERPSFGKILEITEEWDATMFEKEKEEEASTVVVVAAGAAG